MPRRSKVLMTSAVPSRVGQPAQKYNDRSLRPVWRCSANSWLIYFDQIRPNTSNNAVATQPAIITDEAKTNIQFDVELDKPGDFYEFDVYIKNDGTIDAMIDEHIWVFHILI